jgi:hypothetical protein
MDLTKLFSDSSPSVLGFVNRLSVGSSIPPHFPEIFGTGFLVDSSGLAATNRHVIEVFSQLRADPRTGQSALAAVLFFPGDNGTAWQMLLVDVLAWNALAEFSSSDKWYGKTIPDIGFVQLGVRDVPVLRLGTEDFYVQIFVGGLGAVAPETAAFFDTECRWCAICKSCKAILCIDLT